MDISTIIIQNIASTSFFAMRPMLTALFIAFLARGSYEAAVASHSGLIAGGNAFATPWITSNEVLVALCILALIELGANASTDLRFWYEGASGFTQPGSSFVMSFGLIDTQSVYYVELWIAGLPPELLNSVASTLGIGVAVASAGDVATSSAQLAEALSWIGHLLAALWALLMAGGAWLIGRLRAAVLELFFDLDDDDAIGAQSLAVWGEYGWAGVASYLIIAIPFLAIGLFGLTVASLWLARRYFERRERLTMVACNACGGSMHPTALFCPSCRQPNAQPRQVGWFGQPRAEPVLDPAAHRMELIGRKRCPVCATRLRAKDTRQDCAACGAVTFADIAQLNSFLRSLDAKLPRTLVVSGALGLVPLLGIVPAVIYYRLSLIASLRGYVPRSTGCLTRWALRLINLVLIAFQPVPLLGALVVPAMCAISFAVHRKAVLWDATSRLARTFEPVGAASEGQTATLALAAAGAPAALPAEPEVGCPACGAANAAGNRFCTRCGTSIVSK